MSVSRRFTRGAFAVGLAVAALFGVSAPAVATVPAPPPPARPGPVVVIEFRVERVGNGNCRTVVNAFVQTPSKAAAQAIIDRGSEAAISLLADDYLYDDYLYYFGTPRPLQIATSDGRVFISGFPTIPCSRLNEDTSRFESPNDEVYAQVFFRSGGVSQVKVWNDNFSL